jgi:D-sedoheptulose 7-phosphate isomerase
MIDLVRKQLEASIQTMTLVLNDEAIHAAVVEAGRLTAEAMKRGRKLMICGNGGSAADAQHLAAEFVSRLTIDRPALRAIALTTDTSILTAIGNDHSYDNIFERQVEALGQEGDVLLAISTSGNSKNCVKALKLANAIGIHTVALTGNRGGTDGGAGRDQHHHSVGHHDEHPGVASRAGAYLLHGGGAVLLRRRLRQEAAEVGGVECPHVTKRPDCPCEAQTLGSLGLRHALLHLWRHLRLLPPGHTFPHRLR